MFAHIDIKTAALCLITVTSVVQVRLGKYRLTNKPIREESTEKASGIRNSRINSCTLGFNATAKIAAFERIVGTITVRLTRTLLKNIVAVEMGDDFRIHRFFPSKEILQQVLGYIPIITQMVTGRNVINTADVSENSGIFKNLSLNTRSATLPMVRSRGPIR